MGLGDDYINISELGERTSIVGSDIIHIRSTGNIDSKMSITNLFNGIPVDIVQSAGATSLQATTVNEVLTRNSTDSTVWLSTISSPDSYTPYANEIHIKNRQEEVIGSFAGILFEAGSGASGAGRNTARISAVRTANFSTDLVFATRQTSADMIEHMRIASDGAVSIYDKLLIGGATDDGISALQVNGVIKGSSDVVHVGGNEFNILNSNSNLSISQAIDFDFPNITTDGALTRVFRGTNTSGNCSFQVMKGDGTADTALNVRASEGIIEANTSMVLTDSANTVLQVLSTDSVAGIALADSDTTNNVAFERRIDALSILPDGGNVLIGTIIDNGTNKLQVNGSGRFTGGLQCNGILTDNTTLKQKTFTGTLSASGTASFAHGLTQNNIYSIDVIAKNTTGSWQTPGRTLAGSVIYAIATTSNLEIVAGSVFYSNDYRVIITYQA